MNAVVIKRFRTRDAARNMVRAFGGPRAGYSVRAETFRGLPSFVVVETIA